MTLVTPSTADLRDKLDWLRARHDSGAVAPAVYVTIKELEEELAWRQHAALTDPHINADEPAA